MAWGAMEFLLASATPRRRLFRLRDLVLLFLRVALILLIVGALARPMIKAGWLPYSGAREVTIVFDNSLSTARRDGNGTVFEEQLALAEKTIKRLSSADSIQILLTSPVPQWLTDTPVSGNAAGKASLLARLGQLIPESGSSDLAECLLEVSRDKTDKPRFAAVITDGQAYAWRTNRMERWSAVRKSLENAGVEVEIVWRGEREQRAANLAIDFVSASRAAVGASQTVTLNAFVRNTGSVRSSSVLLSWADGEQSIGLSTVPELEPGAGTTASLKTSFEALGVREVSCRLNSTDDLEGDNRAEFLLEVRSGIPVLLVTGESTSDPTASDIDYFLTAVRPGGIAGSRGAVSPFQVKTVSYRDVANENLRNQSVIVLANVPPLSGETVENLKQFARSGGGIWIALGDQTDTSWFNSRFYENGAGLIPAPVSAAIGQADDRENAARLLPVPRDHPATMLLADAARTDLDRARVSLRYPFSMGSAASASALLRVEGGDALALEKPFGRGRVIVQGTPLGISWSSLPLHQAYVVLTHEWLWFLAEPGLVRRNLEAGERLAVPVTVAATTASLELPSGASIPIASDEMEGAGVFQFAETHAPGMYTLAFSETAKSTRLEKILVKRDPQESNLEFLTPAQQAEITRLSGIQFGAEARMKSAGAEGAAPSKPISEALLLTLAAILLGEGALAFWLAQQRLAPAAKALTLESS